jgi:hypothetical protein
MVPLNDPWKKCRLHPLDGATVASYDNHLDDWRHPRNNSKPRKRVRWGHRSSARFTFQPIKLDHQKRCNVKSDSTESLGKYRFLLNWFISARHIQNAVTNLRSNEKKTHWRAQGFSWIFQKKRNSYEVDIEQISTVLAFRWYEIKKRGHREQPTTKRELMKRRGRPFHHHTRSLPYLLPLSGRDFSPCESAPFQWKEKG